MIATKSPESKEQKRLEFRDGIKLVGICKDKGADWASHPDLRIREIYKTASRKYSSQ